MYRGLEAWAKCWWTLGDKGLEATADFDKLRKWLIR